jgi:thioredoxin-dependent peroxiredoxin
MHRRSLLTTAIAWPLALTSCGVRAALDVGERAPDFTLPAARAGQPTSYSLSSALAQGPVVLYFFPLAFSQGCSIEAHSFAEAMPLFEALGASVVGVSADELDVLARFSVQACNGRFPVASDVAMKVVRSFDAAMQTRPDHANRISYVIAPDSRILHVYQSLNPARHVERTLAALREWKAAAPAPR